MAYVNTSAQQMRRVDVESRPWLARVQRRHHEGCHNVQYRTYGGPLFKSSDFGQLNYRLRLFYSDVVLLARAKCWLRVYRRPLTGVNVCKAGRETRLLSYQSCM